MEESEKRRERLRAMRVEAAQAGVKNSESSGLPSHGLSNPLIESENATIIPSQYASPRFDYYTDPMAAFSGSKRRTNISPQVSQGHYNTPPRPMYHQGMTPPPFYQNPPVNPPGQRMYQVSGPHFNQSRPFEAASPLGRPHGNPPSSWGQSRRADTYSAPPNPYNNRGQRYSSSPHYDPGRGRGQSQGRGRSQGMSSGSGSQGRGRPQGMSSGSGTQGRGRSQGMSSGSGSSGGRGAGPRAPVLAELQPDLYYSKDMVEDPWEELSPVIWKGVPTPPDSDKHWLPKSIAMKKAKVSSEGLPISIPQPSLAEYLAASFNDPTNEAVEDEQGT